MNPPVYKTIEDMFRQIEFCGYECEAGKLEMNVAYIQLKESLRWHDAVKEPPKESGLYDCVYPDNSVFDNFYNVGVGWEDVENAEDMQPVLWTEKRKSPLPEPPKEGE